MTDQNAREELLRFLDQKAFDPILRASEERADSDPERQKLEHVKRATERTKQRYHRDYTSAREVHDRYLDDLSSEAAQSVNRDLEALDLPQMGDFRDEFQQLSKRLGVR